MYHRFAVVTSPRSGLHLLEGSLTSGRDDVVLHREILSHYQEYPDYDIHTPVPSIMQERVFHSRYPRTVRSVGFSVHLEHAVVGEWRNLWSWIKEQDDLRIILLRRANMLKMLLSRVNASITGVWGVRRGEPYEPPSSWILRVQQCEEFFLKTTNEYAWIEREFQGLNVMPVCYEDLCDRYREVMEEVIRFLGLPYREVTPVTRKLESRPLSEAITNYRQLKEAFAASRWVEFFDV